MSSLNRPGPGRRAFHRQPRRPIILVQNRTAHNALQTILTRTDLSPPPLPKAPPPLEPFPVLIGKNRTSKPNTNESNLSNSTSNVSTCVPSPAHPLPNPPASPLISKLTAEAFALPAADTPPGNAYLSLGLEPAEQKESEMQAGAQKESLSPLAEGLMLKICLGPELLKAVESPEASETQSMQESAR
uniref:Uncharacterized protein n=1 Tax=Chromera velia CCMP2878 TaxID=1169474 RepID=A0A0G4HX50_9ALVE|eukprot:Cvel_9201.t1-p1 / transcript=Cvel_9201.t1 / gene=Cvel_9201 / organism=Chromera_velia_CCMP2878 / gene_product=hypothetical protein / transcript_product=hypothetical protein / location=Cvel_scaffold524:52407-52964(+) / protein_length=186 / sequence_SO=supercontig / SO=protein_coding / is_pseudo=false